MAHVLKQLHRGAHNGKLARPNVYKRSLEARETTDGFLRLAAGLDTDEPERHAKRWRAVKHGAVVLLAVGLIVAMWVLR